MVLTSFIEVENLEIDIKLGKYERMVVLYSMMRAVTQYTELELGISDKCKQI